MKKKNGGGEGGGANWMDTYGDMVTLLLCFFVLLYSMSTIDENKWKALVQSFNPNATPSQTEIEAGDEHGPFADPNEDNAGITDPAELELAEKEAAQQEIDQAIEMLYQALQQYKEESGVNVEITKGDGGVYLSLEDTVFFDPNSPVLRDDGRQLLEQLAPVLNKAMPYIDEIRVMGHTAQAEEERRNDIYGDNSLSADRAAVVASTLQELFYEMDPEGFDFAKVYGAFYGQNRPIAENNDATRMKNRRVEMVVMGKDLMNQLGGALEQYYTTREEGPGKASSVQATPAPDGGSSQATTSESSASASSGDSSGSSSQEG